MSSFLLFQELSCHLLSVSFFQSLNSSLHFPKSLKHVVLYILFCVFNSVVKRDVVIVFLFITGWLVFLWYWSCNGPSELCQDSVWGSWWSCCEFEWYCCYEGIRSDQNSYFVISAILLFVEMG